MASGAQDQFVVCKHCGSEVSPYITECPYCGHRLQKRAPKIDRDGKINIPVVAEKPVTVLPRLRRGEMPGIRPDAHPYATGALVLLGFVGAIIWRTGWIPLNDLIPIGQISPQWWRIFTDPFIYDNSGYTVVTLGAIAVFGMLLERRHGPIIVLALFFIGGSVGTLAAVDVAKNLIVTGGNGAALAMIVAWAIPDLLEFLGKREFEGDLIMAATIAVVVALMPLAASEASWSADVVGGVAGILIGYPLARLRPV